MTTKPMPKPKPTFVADIEEIRKRAASTSSTAPSPAGTKATVKLSSRFLNEALATEIVCVLRYKRHHYTAKGIHSQAVAEEFSNTPTKSRGHADRTPSASSSSTAIPISIPKVWPSRSHSQYVEGDTLVEMNPRRSDSRAHRHRILLGDYSAILGDNDPTSRRLMENILANEEHSRGNEDAAGINRRRREKRRQEERTQSSELSVPQASVTRVGIIQG